MPPAAKEPEHTLSSALVMSSDGGSEPRRAGGSGARGAAASGMRPAAVCTRNWWRSFFDRWPAPRSHQDCPGRALAPRLARRTSPASLRRAHLPCASSHLPAPLCTMSAPPLPRPAPRSKAYHHIVIALVIVDLAAVIVDLGITLGA